MTVSRHRQYRYRVSQLFEANFHVLVLLGGEQYDNELGLNSWPAAETKAKNTDKWRQLISGPIPHSGARN